MTPDTFSEFSAHALEQEPRECCGLILQDPFGVERYVPCRNLAESLDEFRIHPEDWAATEDQGEVLAVCHSHPGSTSKPGPADIRGCEASQLPWFILGSDGLWRLDPEAHRTALEGRPYSFGWNDCYTVIRDYFGAVWPDFPRYKEDSAALYAAHHDSLGWHEVPREDMQPGDIVLMQIQAPGPNHAAVYVGDGWILHHMAKRLSRTEMFDGFYQAATRRILRREA